MEGHEGDTKTEGSRKRLPLDPVVVSILQAWRQIAPYTGQDDFVFASTALKGKKPVSGDSVRRDHLRPAAIRAGLPPLGRHANIS